MLSEALYKQIFKGEAIVASGKNNSSVSSEDSTTTAQDDTNTEMEDKFEAVETHLSDHNLWGRETTTLEDLDFELPKLLGKNIDEHFRQLATKQTEDYVILADRLKNSKIPNKPTEWKYCAGWTKYGPEGETTKVDFPEEDVCVFDVEVLVQEGNYPTMATALSDKYW